MPRGVGRMKSPYTGKPMVLKPQEITIIYKGHTVTVVDEAWYCKDSDEYFSTNEQDDRLLKRIKKKAQTQAMLKFLGIIKRDDK